MGQDSKVPGDRLVVRADDYNAWQDAARKLRDGKLVPGEITPRDVYPTTVALVRNDDEQDLERFSVVGLGEVLVTPDDNLPEFKRQPTFSVTLPVAGDHEGKFAILLEPLAAGVPAGPDKRPGAIGSAMLIGVCQVGLVGADVGFAEIQDGDPNLIADAGGSAQILWAEPGVDERWATVRIGGGGGSSGALLAKLTAKTYTPLEFRAYDWILVTDSATPTPVAFSDGATSGSYADGTAAYHEQDVDIPVPSIVRIRLGADGEYLIDQLPRIEFIRKTGVPVDIGGITYIPGTLLRYDQATKAVVEEQDILIRDLNTI